MPSHNPIGSCCARPRLNVVGGIDVGRRPLSTPWRTRLDTICGAAVHALCSCAHMVSYVAVWLTRSAKDRGSL